MEARPFDTLSAILRMQKRIVEAYQSHIAEAAGRVGLTKPEADVLLFLSNNPQYTAARDVVRCRGFSKTYVSRAVEKLIARGLLRSEVSAGDRRLQNLSLTAAAADPVCRLQQAQLAFFNRLSAGVTSRERAVLTHLMEVLDGNLDRL